MNRKHLEIIFNLLILLFITFSVALYYSTDSPIHYIGLIGFFFIGFFFNQDVVKRIGKSK